MVNIQKKMLVVFKKRIKKTIAVIGTYFDTYSRFKIEGGYNFTKSVTEVAKSIQIVLVGPICAMIYSERS